MAGLEGLAATIQARLETELPRYSHRRCIYKVPYPMRQTMEDAYTPALVSIGPLHHMNERLVSMEAHKLTYLRSFLRDSQMNADLKTYLKIVKDKEGEIRECYADPIDLSSDEFTQMILIDSVFIIELFKRCLNCDGSLTEDDYVYGRPLMINTIIGDLELEENQLPFFIITILYRTAFKPIFPTRNPSFTEMACETLNVCKDKINVDDHTNETMYCHLLDLLWHHYRPADTPMIRTDVDENTGSNEGLTATQLYDAGIKFRVNSYERVHSPNMVHIHFDKSKGVLTIPKISADSDLELRFRNLLAFEQCHYRPRHLVYFTSFLWFLDDLIDTPEDVQLLVNAKIIVKLMGDNKEVSDIINSLCQLSVLGDEHNSYSGIARQLNRHHKRSWNRHRATLKHTYFKHPWAAISFVYAVILLIFTVIQVMAAIKDLKK